MGRDSSLIFWQQEQRPATGRHPGGAPASGGETEGGGRRWGGERREKMTRKGEEVECKGEGEEEKEDRSNSIGRIRSGTSWLVRFKIPKIEFLLYLETQNEAQKFQKN